MRKLLTTVLFLLPAAALAAAPTTPTPAVSVTVPAISVTVPAVHVTVPAVHVKVPEVKVKVPAEPENPGLTSVMSTTIPAAGLNDLDLTVRVGALKVTAADTDTIKVKVQAQQGGGAHFIFAWSSGTSSAALPANLHLIAHRDGKTLTLCLATDSCNETNVNIEGMGGWKASWQIVVPKRFHVRVRGGVLDAHVRGVAGGLDLKLGVGKLSAYLPDGPVSAKMGVGKIAVSVASPDYGEVHLATGVGDTSFSVRGKKITDGFKREFTSSTQDTTGSGKTDYDLKIGTGAITLQLGVKDAGSTHD